MDHLPNACPPSPTSSDSDEYNTETARVYFGPVKTPERKFVAASQGLFPPPDRAGALRRSPRLSSPRLRSVSPMEEESAQTDNDDIDQVEQLVNVSDEEDSGDLLDSGTATPQKGDDTIDEPSSALADKILHAHDNPSPPPSPPSTLRIFDPYHTTTTETTNDYQSDLMFLNISDRTEGGFQESPLDASAGNTDNEIIPLPKADDPVVNSGELIPIDPVEPPTPSGVIRGSLFPSNLPLSVDDLLSKSPSPQKVHGSKGQQVIPVVVVEAAESDVTMSSEAPRSGLQATTEDRNMSAEVPAVQSSGEALGDPELAKSQMEEPTNTPENLVVTPLRRSTRPRRSVTPNVFQESPPVHPSSAVPSSVTKIRRKQVAANSKDEVVSDSQDEVESRPLAAEQQTTSIVRVRHRSRSPAKNVPSFSRELGSLSPTSSNLLSTLNFTAPDVAQTGGDSFGVPSSSGAPMLSFSVFTPPTDSAAPSTPVRSSGPIRFSSTTKVGASASPTKFTLQPPAPNDPTNTPARRVPVSQAIVQGRMSPEKNTQPGFRFSNTPLPSMPTPARRVLISEGPPSMAMKASTIRLASPTRTLVPRAPSAEPKLGSSLKGKEKAIQSTQEPAGPIAKLPFPIIAAPASTSRPAEISAAGAQPAKQDDMTKAKASPAKSSLRQPTSRIPRIGVKPYARATEAKVTDKPKTIRKVESVITVKPLPKSATSGTASSVRKNVRAVEAPKAPVASTSRVKPTVATTSTVLKRKREQDKSSPVKPRIVRQVPQVAMPPAPTLQPAPFQVPAPDVAPKAKKATTAPRQIRRVMDPEPPKEQPVQPQQPVFPPHAEPSIPTVTNMDADAPTLSIPEVIVSSAPESPSVQQQPEMAPGSPMKQDPPPAPQPSSKAMEAPPTFNLVPEIVVDAADYGLRRTTRSKRAPVRDVFTEGSSRQTSTRRKPVAFHSDDVFSGMSMTALKDLTVSNTVKNQRYLTVQLETEVVHREGLRPESPAVKIRTIVQRQQDEREMRVKERAKRREKRGDGGASDVDHSSDIEIDDAGYSSQVDELMGDIDGDLPKHTRGAGEDDDYVTPERVKRSYKGTRLFVDGNDEQQEEAAPQRRVKWDRGLFTTVYLDEVTLGSRQYLKENRDLKGILAPTAKAIRLDTLGNHPHAETPLADIVSENVTVKKIVYDDDETPAPAAPAVVAKPTRAKSKRK